MNLDEKYNKIIEEKNPKDIKLKVTVFIDEIGMLKVSKAELDYEYDQNVENKKYISEEEYNSNKDKYEFIEWKEEKVKEDKTDKKDDKTEEKTEKEEKIIKKA